MARVLVLLAEGFEEIELATVVDVLRRAGVEVVVAGLAGALAVSGSRGMIITPDSAFNAGDREWDMVVLPGGSGGAERMASHEPLCALLRARVARGRPVAAICAAPMALDAAGVLQSGSFTCYPGVEARLSVRGRLDEPVVDAGAVITSQGPGTAMAFALHLVQRLRGDAVEMKVAKALLYEEQ